MYVKFNSRDLLLITMSDVWQHKESFAITNTHMLYDDVLCNVTIMAGTDKQEIRCHRFILASHSPVFYTMFCCSLPEACVVEIPDVEADVFRTVVKYCNSRISTNFLCVSVHVHGRKTVNVVYCSGRGARGQEIRHPTLDKPHFLKRKLQSTIFGSTILVTSNKRRCASFSNWFLSMSSEAFELILERGKDTPNLSPEGVYESCKRWAKQACSGKEMTGQDLRQKFGDLICLVNFEIMTFESFMNNVCQDAILSEKEKLKILTDIRQRQKKEVKTFLVEIFSNVPQTTNMSEAWQYEEPFAVTNVHMLDADVLCDVTILAGKEKQEVRCHRFMLASRSPVFYTMFCGSLPEASVVEIPDVEADVFRTIVRFMYTGEIQIMPDSVMATMYAAKKYDIQPLTNRCKTFLEKEIAVENVCIILDQASKFEEKELIQQCLSFVSKNADGVFQSDGFLSMSSEIMRYVLEQEKSTPKLPPEEVYASCKKWAEQCCSKSGNEMSDQALRQQFGDLILLVDFPGMSFESFIQLVVKENILSDSEKVTFMKELGDRRKNVKSFSVNRFFNISSGWGHTGKQNGISFRTSKDVVLHSVALYLPCQTGSLSGSLEILEDQTVVLTQNVNLCYQTDTRYEYIHLDRKINIRQGVIYSVRQRLRKGSSYYGFNENGRSDNSTSLTSGQVHGLMLE
ncbi:BTBD2-like protein, partial [Mya arenaria]